MYNISLVREWSKCNATKYFPAKTGENPRIFVPCRIICTEGIRLSSVDRYPRSILDGHPARYAVATRSTLDQQWLDSWPSADLLVHRSKISRRQSTEMSMTCQPTCRYSVDRDRGYRRKSTLDAVSIHSTM